MDELDQIILRSANKLVIEASSKQNGCNTNNISIRFPIAQHPDVWDELPLSRLKQWAYVLSTPSDWLYIGKIPDQVDAFDIAVWLVKQYKAQGRLVELRKWISPNTYQVVELENEL